MVFKKQDLNEVKLIKDEHNKYKLAQKSFLECIKIHFSKNPTKEEILNNLNVKINDESINLADKLEIRENQALIILSQKYECENLEIAYRGEGDLIILKLEGFERKFKALLNSIL
ncbi:hypothetical protein [Campylobacter cuniculorum]|uniref:hypothetical protein n=1 Tax=Campylobacter cuniculorum TaxID=374106 RepID=UPI0023F1A6FC|nr:hypothetical protein [Campylobacter cuniculorum]